VRTGARILQADAQPSTPERWRRRGAQPVRSSSSRGKGKRAPVDAGDRQRQRRPLHPPTDGTTHAPPHPSRSAEEAAEPRLATPRESTRGPTMSSPRRSHSTLDSELSRRNPVLRYPTREYQTDRVAHPPGPPPPQPSPTPTPASKTPASNWGGWHTTGTTSSRTALISEAHLSRHFAPGPRETQAISDSVGKESPVAAAFNRETSFALCPRSRRPQTRTFPLL
jgi:hypothetical protein